jgi:hypothetical protein
MHPALRARVEASVTGRRAGQGRTLSPRVTAIVRALVVVAVVGVVAWVLVVRRRENDKLEAERASLLAAVRDAGASVTDADRGAVARDEAWLVKLAGPYTEDLTAPELDTPGAAEALLARPAVYVRGPASGFASTKGAGAAAAASVKDAFALCLLDPPQTRNESAVLPKVRAAYSGGALIEERTPRVRRLDDGAAGLRVIAPAFEARVRAAKDARELATLKTELDRAPMARAKQALAATLLVAVLDEPETASGPTELDGERAHFVRVIFVDLAAAKEVFRLRTRVDPSVWSPGPRAQLATGLDSCALAFDVREKLGIAARRP